MGNCQCRDQTEEESKIRDSNRDSKLSPIKNGNGDVYQNGIEEPYANEQAFYSFDKSAKQLSDFDIVKKIGAGNFGVVYLVHCASDKKNYAMKVISKEQMKDPKQKEHALNERNVLASNDHPFLLKLYYSFQTDTNLYLITEFVEGADLFINMKYKQRFADSDVQFYCAEIIVALEYLHKKEIIYRDLKPENILLTKQGHIKLADFGLSKILHSREDRAMSKCGTPDYIAPEIVLGNKGHTDQVDIWSLGMMVYELYHGFPPFFSKDKKQQIENCISKDIVINSKISPDAQDFIRKLLQPDPEKRIGKTGLDELKEHPFFKKIDWGKAERGELEPPKPISKETILKEMDYLNKKPYPDSDINLESQQGQRNGSYIAGFSYNHNLPLIQPPIDPRYDEYPMDDRKDDYQQATGIEEPEKSQTTQATGIVEKAKILTDENIDKNQEFKQEEGLENKDTSATAELQN